MSSIQSVIFSLSIFVVLSVTTSCQFHDRFEVDNVLMAAESIRNGQIEFKNRENRYASLDELVRSQLVATELKDGEEFGYRFDLFANADSCVLKVSRVQPSTPPDGGYYEQLSLFLDESGILRASTDPKKEADSHSSIISPK